MNRLQLETEELVKKFNEKLNKNVEKLEKSLKDDEIDLTPMEYSRGDDLTKTRKDLVKRLRALEESYCSSQDKTNKKFCGAISRMEDQSERLGKDPLSRLDLRTNRLDRLAEENTNLINLNKDEDLDGDWDGPWKYFCHGVIPVEKQRRVFDDLNHDDPTVMQLRQCVVKTIDNERENLEVSHLKLMKKLAKKLYKNMPTSEDGAAPLNGGENDGDASDILQDLRKRETKDGYESSDDLTALKDSFDARLKDLQDFYCTPDIDGEINDEWQKFCGTIADAKTTSDAAFTIVEEHLGPEAPTLWEYACNHFYDPKLLIHEQSPEWLECGLGFEMYP